MTTADEVIQAQDRHLGEVVDRGDHQHQRPSRK
jgi:hypothetical protein